MKKKIVILVITIFSSIGSTVFAEGDAGDAGAFLKLGVGSRALGLGKAYVSIAEDATATYWNPAGLVQLKNKELIFMYSPLYRNKIGGINYGTLSYAQPIDNENAIGGSIIYLQVDDIEVVKDVTGPTGEVFGDTEIAIIGSYGRKLNEEILAGGNLKLINQRIKDYSGTGFGLDIGVLYNLFDGLRVGAMIQDLLGASIKLKDKADTMPIKFKIGSSYKTLKDRLLFSGEVNFIKNRSVKWHLGGEYIIIEQLAVRGGYSSDNKEITAGIGFMIDPFRLDYSYGFGDLADTQRVSLNVKL